MKKLITSALLAMTFGCYTTSYAQVKDEVKKDTKVVKKDAKKVGHKTEELASKGKAKVTDKTYADKVGPDGQTIYIDKHSKYYWIDQEGHKNYVIKAQMKDKQ